MDTKTTDNLQTASEGNTSVDTLTEERSHASATSDSFDNYGKSRVLYIIEAALEYFISLLVGGEFLANVTQAIGLSDSLTGILSSFVSLGFSAQIIAIFFTRKKRVKRLVTSLSIINQLAFALIYLVPFISISKTLKTVIFITFLLLGHILNNVVNSPKINWYMSMVPDKKRGRFTATKEIISLIGGMVFSFVSGSLIDYFNEAGNKNGAFVFSSIAIFVLMLFHTATLIFTQEKTEEKESSVSIKSSLSSLIKDKKLRKVIVIPILWYIANFTTIPFDSTYAIKELGFSMAFISITTAIYSVVRSIFSRPLGKFADKFSFANMLSIVFAVQALAMIVHTFVVPENGKVLFIVYRCLNAIAMAGINSGEINLIYDHVKPENRVGALALKNTLAGIAGFVTTIIVSRLVDSIQKSGNKLFGISVYAQQVVSIISLAIIIGIIIYINTVIKNQSEKDT